MKSTTLVLSSLLASAAVAQPHQHHARHHHNKRAETVVWVTDYVTEYTTVDITTTVWVSDGFVVPTTSSPIPTPSPSSSSAEIPAQFFEGGNQPASSSSILVTSTSIYIAPVPVSTYTPPATSEAPVEPAPAPAPSSTSEIPVYVAPAYTPLAETSSAAAAVSSSPAASGSSTGTCSPGSPCQGDITYYEAGLGACGLTTNGTIERVIALPHVLMGTLSNTNPYCGKTVTIKCTATGKTTTATVVDKCMGCENYAIDLSNAAFEELDDLAIGRTTATWWFN
ncbi:hypothetical protein N431DRAFT_435171 [Stipitochalara longipes BDJ]|nr:hypothetical protein N431DRAFT_435171 [Stipitochalara longipes BDJ]